MTFQVSTFTIMFLIADSGSTKTDWYFCAPKDGVVKKAHTVGFNPIVQSEDFIRKHIYEAFQSERLSGQVKNIYFFGAGCSSKITQAKMEHILSEVFTHSTIEVSHDMQAAIIATCGDQPGFACILGTGSNAILYDGSQAVSPKGSLGIGYMLGDEGSGAYIGKVILRDFLYENMPKDMLEYMKVELGWNKDKILHQVYKEPNANTFIASVVKEVYRFRNTNYMQEVVADAFSDFFKFNIQIYQEHLNLPVHFIGSIATHFDKELISAADKVGVQVGQIIKKPIDNIVEYYLQKADERSH